jgi:D-alanine transaminase
MIVFLNGDYLPRERACLSPEDRGFLFADAVYEVVRFSCGSPFHLAEHLGRLAEGLAALRIEARADFFPDVARRLLEENGLGDRDALVYGQVSRGAAPRTHAFPPPGTRPTVFAFARESDPAPAGPASRAILLPDERWGRCNIKTVMLLPNVLAAQRAAEAGAIDAILVRDGLALEATKANLFAVRDGTVRTAPNGPAILPGVTRSATIAAARRLGIPVEERALSVDELLGASEVFLASTTLWTASLVEVEGRTIGDGRPGPVAARLKAELQREFREPTPAPSGIVPR